MASSNFLLANNRAQTGTRWKYVKKKMMNNEVFEYTAKIIQIL